MHAHLLPQHPTMQDKRTLNVINGHLPLALERKVHSLEQLCTLVGKMFSFFCVLGDLKCLAAALYSYSPNLEEVAQCSMITPLTF